MMGKMGKMCGLHKAAMALVIIGALNWGLVGALNMNLVEKLLGAWPMVERIVYVLVGLSGLAMLASTKCCMKCESCGMGMEEKKPAAPAAGMPKA
jgi:uncharacterized membrane protein YuzA (DUF378 family)